MTHTNLLIASSSFDEAITRCVLKHKRHFAYQIDVVLIHELLTDFNIHDELSDEGSIIRWFKTPKKIISNQTHYLLNRTLSIHDDLFSKFIKKDRDYAKREFEAYLGYSFSSFKGLDNQTVNGICGSFHSLPEQWQKVQKNTILSTPKYYWGPKSHCSLKLNIIYSDIYNIFNWSTTHPRPQTPHIFCFEKPKGLPLFILSVGKKIFITSTVKLSAQTQARIQKTLRAIQTCFGYFIFEVLLFIHDNHILFGCINLELTRTKKHPNFEAFICKHLAREYITCLT